MVLRSNAVSQVKIQRRILVLVGAQQSFLLLNPTCLPTVVSTAPDSIASVALQLWHVRSSYPDMSSLQNRVSAQPMFQWNQAAAALPFSGECLH